MKNFRIIVHPLLIDFGGVLDLRVLIILLVVVVGETKSNPGLKTQL